MTFSAQGLGRDVALLVGFHGRDLVSMPADDFAALRQTVGRVRRVLDSLTAEVAGEAARRSAPEHGARGLARSEGRRSPEELIAEDLGVNRGDA